MADHSNDDHPRRGRAQMGKGLAPREVPATVPVSVPRAADGANEPAQRTDTATDAEYGAHHGDPEGTDVPRPKRQRTLDGRTAADIEADIEKAKKDLDEAHRDKKKYEAVADDLSRTPEERTQANRRLDATIDIIKINTDRLASQNDLRTTPAAQPPQPPAPPVFGTLEELILAMGGKGKKGP